MIDHVYLPVRDLERSRAFYQQLLTTIGVEETMTLGESVGFGVGTPGALWIYPTAGRSGTDEDACGLDPVSKGPLPHIHVAFQAATREDVQKAFRVAQRLGAEIVHPPRLFPDYHTTYFATFIRDPDGHNVEVVCPHPPQVDG